MKSVLKPPLRLFLAGEFFVRFSEMYSLFMPLYLSQLGATVVDIGLVYSLAEILPFALSIIGGWFSDRFGRLRVITWGNIVKLLGFGVLVATNQWQWMILGMSLVGASGAIAGPGFSAFIADQTETEHLAKVYSVQLNIKNLISLIMFPMAGLIGAKFGFNLLILAAGIFHVIGSILLGLIEPVFGDKTLPIKDPSGKTRNQLPLRKSLGLLIGLILAGGIFTWVFIIDHLNDIFLGMSQSLQVLYFENVIGISLQQIGYLPAIGAIVGLIVTIPLGYWVDKRGENVGLGLAYLLLAFFIGIPLFARNFMMLIPTAILYPIMVGLAAPSYNSLISKIIPQDQRGVAFGLTSTSRGLVSIPAPYLGGMLWDRFNPRTPFIFAIIGCFGLSLLAFLKLKNPQGDMAETS